MSRRLKRDTPRYCLQCKKEFYVSKKNFLKNFCSSKCRDTYHNKEKCRILREVRSLEALREMR